MGNLINNLADALDKIAYLDSVECVTCLENEQEDQLAYSNIDIYLAASQLSELLRDNIINLNVKSDLNEEELKKVKYLYKLLKVDDSNV